MSKRKADDKVTKIGQMNGLGAARDATTGGRTAAWLLLPQARSSWVAAGGRGDHEAGRCPRQANEKRRQSDADFNQSQGFDIETQKFKIKINSKRIQLESSKRTTEPTERWIGRDPVAVKNSKFLARETSRKLAAKNRTKIFTKIWTNNRNEGTEWKQGEKTRACVATGCSRMKLAELLSVARPRKKGRKCFSRRFLPLRRGKRASRKSDTKHFSPAALRRPRGWWGARPSLSRKTRTQRVSRPHAPGAFWLGVEGRPRAGNSREKQREWKKWNEIKWNEGNSWRGPTTGWRRNIWPTNSANPSDERCRRWQDEAISGPLQLANKFIKSHVCNRVEEKVSEINETALHCHGGGGGKWRAKNTQPLGPQPHRPNQTCVT